MSRASMTIRGGGDPNPRMALRPTCRMGPPLRSSAADAYYCDHGPDPGGIYRIQVCGAMLSAQLASSPQIVQVPMCPTQVPRLKIKRLTGNIPYKACVKVPARPFFIGNPGWVRSSACICDFSSTESTMAWAGGLT